MQRLCPSFLRPAFLLVVATFLAACGAGDAYAQPAHSLTVGEGFVSPLGFHDATPRFSWKLPAGAERQTAYRLEVVADGDRWESGWVESPRSVFVEYGGRPLRSGERVRWRVQVRDEQGEERPWSERAELETGLLSAEDWQAHWIHPAGEIDPHQERVAWLRRVVSLGGEVARARLHVTARGVFQVEINGERVGRDHFANGWTSYEKRLDTLTYDVTEQLRSGENTLRAMLGTGWYAGKLGWRNKVAHYGRRPEFLCQLEIELADGKELTVVSDGEWQGTYDGPVLSSSLYDGERHDARRAVEGWAPVVANAELGPARLTPKPLAPVRVVEELSPQQITEPAPGKFVFDLGQNMVGCARISVPTEQGETITLRTSEMLKADGTLYTEAYRTAESTDRYTAAETGRIEWRPSFTFHGFRYVELSGLPAGAEPQASWVSGLVMHSDLDRVGRFDSSHAKLNQLQSNIVWGQRGNFLDIPTDCPQRDERLGWTGDAQVFCPTSMFNYDSHAFWKSWLGSMRDDQFDDGRIPHVVPDVLGNGGSPGWMDAAVVIPWEVYVRTGDTELLADNLPMMERLVGWYRSQSTDGRITEIKSYGDWLQPYSESNKGDTPAALIGTAYYARCADLLSRAAKIVGRDDLARRYADEADRVKAAFAGHYFDSEGTLQNAPPTQTAYLLAIAFELIPSELHGRAAEHVVRLVGEADGHLRTGFLGTPLLVRTLEEQGYPELAYELLLKESYPSWFYSINQGATTMWERWNSYSHADGFGNVSMNSFNHYAYGAIGQWMYERVAGLAPDPAHPGYKHFFVRPLVDGSLESAGVELETAYGLAASSWQKEGGRVTMRVVTPPNTTATIEFPTDRASETVGPGEHEFELELE
ncbi:Bacterial alpha-L-rhamnosidase [Pseudobythopirellula maris]|uniref:alpha-L-rhamnosidase n=1 Tax=Pseudobythopirellula maris TaxID=2527991 RepID=A0A5C5ZIF3_9BACT|nr:alpha-L-rhamnosidase [Pseudobythopirellula maris]TWT86581.1 Bacterial alpha-L-rhamnosidase [Pseudobythopirellula maris]